MTCFIAGSGIHGLESKGISPVAIPIELQLDSELSPSCEKKYVTDIQTEASGHETIEMEDIEEITHDKQNKLNAETNSKQVGFFLTTHAAVDTDHMSTPEADPQHTQAFTSQDMGYQTNSLHLTNYDTGLHTNLTNQFQNLPLSSTVIDEEDGMPMLNLQSKRNPNHISLDDASWIHSLVTSHQVAPPSFTSIMSQTNQESAYKSQTSQESESKSGNSSLISGLTSTATDSDYGSYQSSQFEDDSIVRRAREVLARIDKHCPVGKGVEENTKTLSHNEDHFSSEENDRLCSLTTRMMGNVGVPLFPWNPAITVPTPQRQTFQKLGVLSETPSSSRVLSSKYNVYSISLTRYNLLVQCFNYNGLPK